MLRNSVVRIVLLLDGLWSQLLNPVALSSGAISWWDKPLSDIETGFKVFNEPTICTA
jgi:hypothetical protein